MPSAWIQAKALNGRCRALADAATGADCPLMLTAKRPQNAASSILVAGILAALAAACGDPSERTGASTSDPVRSALRIVAVTHGVSANPFWSVVINGLDDAGRDMGVRVEYQAPNTFDMVTMSQLIDAAVASRPDGLVVSVPDPDALGAAIRAAVEAGIPVITINSGEDASAALGALAHVGQAEYDAGFGGGERLAGAGVRRVLCVNQEVGNAALDTRCQGLTDALGQHGVPVSVLAVELADPEDTRQRVVGALLADPEIDGILTLGTTGAEPALLALRDLGRVDDVHLGTFDLSTRVLEAIRDGEIDFAIDQQQYLQGYLPVVLLTLYLETGTVPGGGRAIATGPGFVTIETAEQVMDLTSRGLR
jgi:simple sugar transport system substrate-binding protein